MNNKNNLIGGVIVLIIAIAGGFYGGMQFGAKNIQAKNAQDQQVRGVFAGGGNGGQRAGGGQRGGMQNGGPNGGAGDFSGGQITAKDDTSITVKTRNGSSQIIFVAPSATIDKSVSGAISDLSIGQQITANGKSSPDGSLAAQNIQIRPTLPNQQ
jgi:uncharacterized protein (UPF0333 family)